MIKQLLTEVFLVYVIFYVTLIKSIILTIFFLKNVIHFRAAAAALAAQTGTGRSSRKIVPPLLRSKTLPAIITPASVVCRVAKKGLLIGKFVQLFVKMNE